jgi:hypothetical protein
VGSRSSTAVLLVATVTVLNVVGVVMVLSASSVASLTDYGSPWYFFVRQLLWTALGLAAFVFGIRFDYRNWRRVVRPLLALSTALLVIVLVPGVGIYVSGSRITRKAKPPRTSTTGRTVRRQSCSSPARRLTRSAAKSSNASLAISLGWNRKIPAPNQRRDPDT